MEQRFVSPSKSDVCSKTRKDLALADLLIRKLKQDDLENGFLQSLDSLRQASGISKTKSDEVFHSIESNWIFVALDGDRIVGTCTLLIESKFIHDGGIVGHIEDVSVDAKYQGTGVGGTLVKAVLEAAAKMGCYKTILDCKMIL